MVRVVRFPLIAAIPSELLYNKIDNASSASAFIVFPIAPDKLVASLASTMILPVVGSFFKLEVNSLRAALCAISPAPAESVESPYNELFRLTMSELKDPIPFSESYTAADSEDNALPVKTVPFSLSFRVAVRLVKDSLTLDILLLSASRRVDSAFTALPVKTVPFSLSFRLVVRSVTLLLTTDILPSVVAMMLASSIVSAAAAIVVTAPLSKISRVVPRFVYCPDSVLIESELASRRAKSVVLAVAPAIPDMKSESISAKPTFKSVTSDAMTEYDSSVASIRVVNELVAADTASPRSVDVCTCKVVTSDASTVRESSVWSIRAVRVLFAAAILFSRVTLRSTMS